MKEVRRFTDRRGVDVVFEHVGQATWETSMKSLKRGGRLVTCGATGRSSSRSPKRLYSSTDSFWRDESRSHRVGR